MPPKGRKKPQALSPEPERPKSPTPDTTPLPLSAAPRATPRTSSSISTKWNIPPFKTTTKPAAKSGEHSSHGLSKEDAKLIADAITKKKASRDEETQEPRHSAAPAPISETQSRNSSVHPNPEIDDDIAAAIEEFESQDADLMQSEEEREPTPIASTNKGKGREIDSISVIDQHGEQLEANPGIAFVPLQGRHTLKPLASPKDRHIAKSEDQLRGTQDEEMEDDENIVTTLQGKKIDIEDLDDTSDEDDDIPFASAIASINPVALMSNKANAFTPLTYASDGTRFKWQPEPNILTSGMGHDTLMLLNSLGKRSAPTYQPNLVAGLVLGRAYEPRGVGFVNAEGSRLASHRMTNPDVQIIVVRSAREDEEAKARELGLPPPALARYVGGKPEDVPFPLVLFANLDDKSRRNLLHPPMALVANSPDNLDFLLFHVQSYIPHHVLVMGGSDFTPANTIDLVKIIRKTLLENNTFRKMFRKHSDAHYLADKANEDEKLATFFSSITAIPMLMKGGGSALASYRFIIYMTPFMTTLRTFLQFRAHAATIVYPKAGEVLPMFSCNNCRATDHPVGYCPLQTVPNSAYFKRDAKAPSNALATAPKASSSTTAINISSDEDDSDSDDGNPFVTVAQPSRFNQASSSRGREAQRDEKPQGLKRKDYSSAAAKGGDSSRRRK